MSSQRIVQQIMDTFFATTQSLAYPWKQCVITGQTAAMGLMKVEAVVSKTVMIQQNCSDPM
jgi:hypothetical protein